MILKVYFNLTWKLFRSSVVPINIHSSCNMIFIEIISRMDCVIIYYYLTKATKKCIQFCPFTICNTKINNSR